VKVTSSGPWEFPFEPWGICKAHDIYIEQGASYRVQIALPTACPGTSNAASDQPRRTGLWTDGSWPVESLAGFPASRGWIFSAALPFRRVLYEDWFVPIATIGTALPERHALTKPETEFTATRSGRLTLFVNDAVFPCPGWDCFYRNNSGGPARVRVTRLPADQSPSKSEPLKPYSCDEQMQITMKR
jgi:hypothetical protein